MASAIASFLGAFLGTLAAHAWLQRRKMPLTSATFEHVEPVIRKAFPKGGKLKPKVKDDLAAWHVEQEG